MSVERFVALLTPLFAIVAGFGTSWVARHFPGLPPMNPAEVAALFGVGMVTAGSAALKWLHGRAHYTADLAKVKLEYDKLQKAGGPALADIEALIKAHEPQLLAAVDARAPVAVQQALSAALAGVSGQPVAVVNPVT